MEFKQEREQKMYVYTGDRHHIPVYVYVREKKFAPTTDDQLSHH